LIIGASKFIGGFWQSACGIIVSAVPTGKVDIDAALLRLKVLDYAQLDADLLQRYLSFALRAKQRRPMPGAAVKISGRRSA